MQKSSKSGQARALNSYILTTPDLFTHSLIQSLNFQHPSKDILLFAGAEVGQVSFYFTYE